MEPETVKFLSGMGGFFAYETIRLYRISITPNAPPPFRAKYRRLYYAVLPALALLSGGATLVLDATSPVKAAVIGYLFTSGVGALMRPVPEVPAAALPGGVAPEEVERVKLGFVETFRRAVREYFR